MKQLPAILGGQKEIHQVHQFQTRVKYQKQDWEDVAELMKHGDLSTHPVIRQLEQDYCQQTERRYGLAHCNGTAALLASFFAIGLKPGDEVIVPAATFWASASPMTWLGAVPVFCESETMTLGPDPKHIESLITEKTRAIVMVHLWGMPCQVDEILDIAKRHNLKVIEDASHAHGAIYKGKPCGSFGDISVLSLQGDKLAPGGEGGILLCDEYSFFEKACCLGDITRIIELDSPARRFAGTGFGLKTRIAPISALIAKNSLARLDDTNKQREMNCHMLIEGLQKYQLSFCQSSRPNKRVFFELIAQVKDEQLISVGALEAALQAEGCMIGVPRYPLLHQQPFFTEGTFNQFSRLEHRNIPDYSSVTLPTTEATCKSMLAIPMLIDHKELIPQYIKAFDKVMNSAELIESTWRKQNA
ncbi:MAG: DegT/DnrJ/EryC1/StrS family aminotransferase [Pseudobacteriovorax sp.]|nr:DegT/DnrJ/EryC1/StrS family aminotransferase [Pseudobacteriovorax sp.]